MEAAHRRESDITKRIILWGSLAGAVGSILVFLAYGAKAYVRISDVLDKTPQNTERIEKIERWKDIQDERTEQIQWWMSQIGKKMGVPAPPPQRGRHRDDREE